MDSDIRQRLLEEADTLIRQSDLNEEEKENLTQNIRYFISEVKYDQTLKDAEWQWFDEGPDGHGLDLVWNNEYVRGCFGFYTDNGHGFSFEGDGGDWFLIGGEGGEHGFSCSIFVRDFEDDLKYMGYI